MLAPHGSALDGVLDPREADDFAIDGQIEFGGQGMAHLLIVVAQLRISLVGILQILHRRRRDALGLKALGQFPAIVFGGPGRNDRVEFVLVRLAGRMIFKARILDQFRTIHQGAQFSPIGIALRRKGEPCVVAPRPEYAVGAGVGVAIGRALGGLAGLGVLHPLGAEQ